MSKYKWNSVGACTNPDKEILYKNGNRYADIISAERGGLYYASGRSVIGGKASLPPVNYKIFKGYKSKNSARMNAFYDVKEAFQYWENWQAEEDTVAVLKKNFFHCTPIEAEGMTTVVVEKKPEPKPKPIKQKQHYPANVQISLF